MDIQSDIIFCVFHVASPCGMQHETHSRIIMPSSFYRDNCRHGLIVCAHTGEQLEQGNNILYSLIMKYFFPNI